MALRSAGIDISRSQVITILQNNRNSEEWILAVSRLALQEILVLEFQDLNLRALQNRARNNPREVLDSESRILYDWFINRLRTQAPMPFERDDERQNRHPQLLDLLAEHFHFNVQIVETIEDRSRIIRYFRENRNRRITLRWTSGEIGHFELIAPDTNPYPELPSSSPRKILYDSPLSTIYITPNHVIKYIKTMDAMKEHQYHHALQNCPWIVPLREVFFDRKHISSYIVMPRARTDLFDWLDQKSHNHTPENNQNNSVPELIAIQFILGLHHIHTLGHAHRDLKNENVLIFEPQSDLPLCQLCDFAYSGPNYKKYGLIGTIAYQAPECLKGNCSDASKSDCFSLGIALSIILDNIYPFGILRSSSDHILPQNILNDNRTKLPPSPHFNLINRLLSPDPNQRPTTTQILNEEPARSWLGRLLNRISDPIVQRAVYTAQVFAGTLANLSFPVHVQNISGWHNASLFIRQTDFNLCFDHKTITIHPCDDPISWNASSYNLPEAYGFGILLQDLQNHRIIICVFELRSRYEILDCFKKIAYFNLKRKYPSE